MPRDVKKGVNTKNFDSCVGKVKDKSVKKVNPYAVCNATKILSIYSFLDISRHIIYNSIYLIKIVQNIL